MSFFICCISFLSLFSRHSVSFLKLSPFNGSLDLRQHGIRLVADSVDSSDQRDGGVVVLKGVHVYQQGDHANVACYGEDVDGCRGFFSDVDFLVCDVIADCEGLLAREGRVSVSGHVWGEGGGIRKMNGNRNRGVEYETIHVGSGKE